MNMIKNISEDNIDEFYYINASCVLVKGAKRSIIQDLQRDKILLIPNILYEILTNFDKIRDVIEYYGKKNKTQILEYFNFVNNFSCLSFCNSLNKRVEIDSRFFSPKSITNAIIDLDINSTYDVKNVIFQLNEIGCEALEIRVFKSLDIQEIQQLLELTQFTTLRSVYLVLQFSEFCLKQFLQLKKSNPRLQTIVFFSAPNNKIFENHALRVVYTQKRMTSHADCCSISVGSFNSKIEFYTESQNHNTCLNRKISVDTYGEIRNCPSMFNSFGNVNTTLLKDALMDEKFKEFWNLTKDQIDVCKECEFRHICMDCRAHRLSNNIFSKPSRCSYDPYKKKWNE